MVLCSHTVSSSLIILGFNNLNLITIYPLNREDKAIFGTKCKSGAVGDEFHILMIHVITVCFSLKFNQSDHWLCMKYRN